MGRRNQIPNRQILANDDSVQAELSLNFPHRVFISISFSDPRIQNIINDPRQPIYHNRLFWIREYILDWIGNVTPDFYWRSHYSSGLILFLKEKDIAALTKLTWG